MSVRKHRWTTAKGVLREAWLVDFKDGCGKRRARMFARKEEADAFAKTAHIGAQQRIRISVVGKCVYEHWRPGHKRLLLRRARITQPRL
jgi:hypothetical protein